jgi:hypothetical protein
LKDGIQSLPSNPSASLHVRAVKEVFDTVPFFFFFGLQLDFFSNRCGFRRILHRKKQMLLPWCIGVYFFESMTGAFLRAKAHKNRAFRSNTAGLAPQFLRYFRCNPLRGRRIESKSGALTGVTRRRKVTADAPLLPQSSRVYFYIYSKGVFPSWLGIGLRSTGFYTEVNAVVLAVTPGQQRLFF